MHIWETILTRTTSKPYPVFLQNVDTKDRRVCVVLGPRHMICRCVPKLKLCWGKATLLSETTTVKLPLHVQETILTRTTSLPYPVFPQNVNTKVMRVCVVLGPRPMICRCVPKLKLSWGQPR